MLVVHLQGLLVIEEEKPEWLLLKYIFYSQQQPKEDR